MASIYPVEFEGFTVHIVGVKGTGTSALAELLVKRGATVSGSDLPEVFYTDKLLAEDGIAVYESFDSEHVTDDVNLLIHSAAYDAATHPEIVEARRRGIPIASFNEALGSLSRNTKSAAISGVHGKSTTTGMCGTLLQALGVPASIIAGAAVSTFGGRPTLHIGDEFFVAETDEYRSHFLAFSPRWMIITSVELDHPDYFSSYESIRDTFETFAGRLPSGGTLIYCADDAGASDVAAQAGKRGDLDLIPYGQSATGRKAFKIHTISEAAGSTRFRIGDWPAEVVLRVPGAHNVMNATAAMALCASMHLEWRGHFTDADFFRAASALGSFRGSTRRSEVVGERAGVLYMDDYGHHPTAIRKTISGLKAFYPDRRLVVDFMPHTYSRTGELFDGFVTAFDATDVLILHAVYPSARETLGSPTGRDLFNAVRDRRASTYYFEEHNEAVSQIANLLLPGDLFLTLGAGDNWKVGQSLFRGEAS